MSSMPTSASDLQSETALADALECIAQSLNVPFDRLVVTRSLAEATRFWPGEELKTWSIRLIEVGESLGIRFVAMQCDLARATQIASPDTPIMTFAQHAGRAPSWLVVTDAKGKRLLAARAESNWKSEWMNVEQVLPLTGAADADSLIPWVVAQPALSCREASSGGDHHDHGASLSPFARLMGLLRPEWKDIWSMIVFAILVGVLALATPIAVEALVNMVSFGQLLQPILVLSFMLAVFLGFGAAIQAVRNYIAELIQRRLFVRIVADLAYRFPRVRREAIDAQHAPELANRFFEVVIVQKSTASLLLDGIALALATIIGMAVLTFYHPLMLGFNAFLLLMISVAIFVLGRNAVPTSIQESRAKYAVGAWLEELMRHPVTFRYHGGPELALAKADHLAVGYVTQRMQHFRIVFRQLMFTLGLEVVVSTVLLGLGGWLVIAGQLTLGQLVAAELIVTAIVGSFTKLAKYLEVYYDLLAAVDKLGHLFDIPLEHHEEYFHPHPQSPATLHVRGLSYRYGTEHALFEQVEFQVASGDCLAILGPPGSGKSTIMELIFGMREPITGRIEFDHVDLRELRADSIRERIAFAQSVEVFAGTLAENVHLHRSKIGIDDVRRALHSVGLLDRVMQLPGGLEHPLATNGAPLSSNQARLLMLARAIAGRPRLLLLDGILDGLPDDALERIVSLLTAPDVPWTTVLATCRDDIASKFGQKYSLPNKDAHRPQHLANSASRRSD
jgi:ABC-type bacteriocin/lantibiotic exporter with double-glycine peptidase domain